MLIGAFGVGMIGAGCFTADPAFGFPPGTPPEANTISWHGIVHLSVATLGFAALIAAGFVWTRRFASQRRWGWAAYSAITALIFFVSFAGLASGQLFLTPVFVVTALNAFVWVSVMAAMLLSGEPRTSA
jgi:drug/metabolite transporter (DMT)-like permease